MRPVFLNLFKIQLPLAALISIKHRLSGVFFFCMFPLFLYIYSLVPLGNELSVFCQLLWVQIALWLSISAFLYHFIAGMRHMFFDFGRYHSRKAIFRTSVFVMVLTVLVMLIVAYRIWG